MPRALLAWDVVGGAYTLYDSTGTNITGITTQGFNTNPAYVDLTGQGFGIGIYNQFDHLTNTSDFDALFDMYKLLRVEFKITYLTDRDNTNYPEIEHYEDHDDFTVPSRNTFDQLQNVRRFRFGPDNRTYTFSYRPTMKIAAAYGTGTDEAPYVICAAKFIDMAHKDIRHYGSKLNFRFLSPMASGAAPGSVPQFIIERRLRFVCTGVQ